MVLGAFQQPFQILGLGQQQNPLTGYRLVDAAKFYGFRPLEKLLNLSKTERMTLRAPCGSASGNCLVAAVDLVEDDRPLYGIEPRARMAYAQPKIDCAPL